MNKKENPHTFRYRGFPRHSMAAGAVRHTAAEARMTGSSRVKVFLQLVGELIERPVHLRVGTEFGGLHEENELGHFNEHLVVDLVSVHDTNLSCLCS